MQTDSQQQIKEYQQMLNEQIEEVVVRISLYEAALLRIVRRHPYSTLIIEVKKGQPRYCKPQGSEILRPEDGLAFAVETIGDDKPDKVFDLADIGKPKESSI